MGAFGVVGVVAEKRDGGQTVVAVLEGDAKFGPQHDRGREQVGVLPPVGRVLRKNADFSGGIAREVELGVGGGHGLGGARRHSRHRNRQRPCRQPTHPDRDSLAFRLAVGI